MALPKLQQPLHTSMCGPYCIVACIRDLELPDSVINVAQFDTATQTFSKRWTTIDTSLQEHKLASKIYSITGIGALDNPNRFVAKDGGNPLFMMSHVLMSLGFSIQIQIVPDAHKVIRRRFPIEFSQLKQLGVNLTEQRSHRNETKRQLKISLISFLNDEGLLKNQWILNDERGTWFDSESESGHHSWDEIEQWHQSENKKPTASWEGVSIIISY